VCTIYVLVFKKKKKILEHWAFAIMNNFGTGFSLQSFFIFF
jgi:hypothetical protein